MVTARALAGVLAVVFLEGCLNSPNPEALQNYAYACASTADCDGGACLSGVCQTSASDAGSGCPWNGAFTLAQSLSLGASEIAGQVALGDFNHDGYLDLAIAGGETGSVLIALNDQTGHFGTPQAMLLLNPDAGTAEPDGLLAADLDGDGLADLAVVDALNGTLDVLLGLPDGGFSAVAFSALDGNGYGMTGVATGHFSADGRVDLVTVTEDGVFLFLRDDAGAYQSASPIPLASNGNPFYTGPPVVADVNGDGRDDVLVAGNSNDSDTGFLSLLTGSPGGGLGQPTSIQVGNDPFQVALWKSAGGVLSAAVTNSGTDVCGSGSGTLGSTAADSSVSVLPVQSGSFGAQAMFSTVLGDAGREPHGLVAMDFDGDGRTDLAVASDQPTYTDCGGGGFNCPDATSDSTVTILAGLADGGFAAVGSFATPTSYAFSLITGRLTGDGGLSLIVSSRIGCNPGSTVSVFQDTCD